MELSARLGKKAQEAEGEGQTTLSTISKLIIFLLAAFVIFYIIRRIIIAFLA